MSARTKNSRGFGYFLISMATAMLVIVGATFNSVVASTSVSNEIPQFSVEETNSDCDLNKREFDIDWSVPQWTGDGCDYSRRALSLLEDTTIIAEIVQPKSIKNYYLTRDEYARCGEDNYVPGDVRGLISHYCGNKMMVIEAGIRNSKTEIQIFGSILRSYSGRIVYSAFKSYDSRVAACVSGVMIRTIAKKGGASTEQTRDIRRVFPKDERADFTRGYKKGLDACE